MMQQPHLCLITHPAFAATRGMPCPLRTVVTIGRVRPTSVVGYCAGCSPRRVPDADRVSGSALSNSAGIFGQLRATPATMSAAR